MQTINKYALNFKRIILYFGLAVYCNELLAQTPVALNTAPSNSKNYIVTYKPLMEGITNPTNPSNTNYQVSTSILYMDGLGRPVQNINVKGSYGGNDVIEPVVYDSYGRETRKYLPYIVSGNSGAYRSDAVASGSGVFSFYNPTGSGTSGNQQTSGIPVIPNPYAETAFDQSPLDRVVEQGAPGDSWQLSGTVTTSGFSSGHTQRVLYRTTNANAVSVGAYYAKKYNQK
jgi:hypothetical protein